MAKVATVPTPSKARNLMKRALREIIDPSPTVEERDALWERFDSCCIFCGRRLDPQAREGHLDHLDSSTGGGGNSIGNRVLACGKCNGDEKREQDWKAFLAQKCPDKKERERRLQLIRDWQAEHKPRIGDLRELEKVLHDVYATAEKAYNNAIDVLKKAVDDAAKKAKG